MRDPTTAVQQKKKEVVSESWPEDSDVVHLTGESQKLTNYILKPFIANNTPPVFLEGIAEVYHVYLCYNHLFAV